MRTLNKVWAIGIFGGMLYVGTSVMLGHYPGATSGVGTFERLAALFAMAAAEIGNVLTGLGLIVIGALLSLYCLFETDTEDRGSSFFDSDGCGGDGGGD